MAPHLARSYHHLFPLEPFSEINFVLDENSEVKNRSEYVLYFKKLYISLIICRNCTGCQFLMNKNAFQCSFCKKLYCIECDIFIHETLHSCPSCTSPIN